MTVIRLQTLGEVLIEVGGVRLAPAATRAFATLLYLGVERDRRVSRASLQGLMFPGSSEANASHSLRQLLYRLRQMHVPVEAEGETVSLPAGRVTDDYSHLVSGARFTTDQLTAIAAGFLPGYSPSFSEPFEEWLDSFRSRVTLQFRRLLVEQLAESRRRGEWQDVERAARACLGLDPLNEPGTLALSEALAMTGSKVEAIRLLDNFVLEVARIDASLAARVKQTKTRISERVTSDSYRVHRKLCGRASELSELASRLDRARRGRLQCVVLAGPEGIGKTTIARAFVERIALLDIAFAHWACRSSGLTRPMGVFAGCVPELIHLPGALGCTPESLQLLSRLTQHDVSVELLSREARASDVLFADITFALGDLIEAITSEQTLVLAFDDADHADVHSLKALCEITRRHDCRLLLILTAENAASCAQILEHLAPQDRSILTMQGLSAAEIIELISTVGSDPSQTELDSVAISQVLAITAGNPLSVLALTHQYRSEGEQTLLQGTLNYAVDKRLEGLSSEARRLLEACIVLGERSSMSRLANITGLDPTQLLAATRELDRALLIQCECDHLRCSHELIAQAVCRSITDATRRALHYAAAIMLENEFRSSSSSFLLWACAEHWEAAADLDRANYYVRKCARHAIEMGQPSEAVAMLKRLLLRTTAPSEHLAILKETIQAAELAADWQTVSSLTAGLRAEQVRVFGQAEDHSESELLEIQAQWRTGAALADQLPRLVQCATSDDSSPSHRTLAAWLLLAAADLTFNSKIASIAHRQILAEYPSGSISPEELSKCSLVYHVAFGDALLATAEARSIVKNAPAISPPTNRCNLLYNAGLAFTRLGLPNEAAFAFGECYATATDRRLHTYQLLAAAGAACVFRTYARLEQSDEWHNRATAVFERIEVGGAAPQHYSNCIERALTLGDIEDAARWLSRAQADYLAVGSARPRLTFLAYKALVSPPTSKDTRRNLLKELLEGHTAARGFGLHDVVVLAIARLLDAELRHAEAAELVLQYATRHRRDGFPMHVELREWLVGDPWLPTLCRFE